MRMRVGYPTLIFLIFLTKPTSFNILGKHEDEILHFFFNNFLRKEGAVLVKEKKQLHGLDEWKNKKSEENNHLTTLDLLRPLLKKKEVDNLFIGFFPSKEEMFFIKRINKLKLGIRLFACRKSKNIGFYQIKEDMAFNNLISI